MSQDREPIREVAWLDVFPGLRLFGALRMALNFRLLVLSAIAIVGTAAGWRLCGQLFADSENVELRRQIEANSAWPWESSEENLALMQVGAYLSPENWPQQSPLLRAWLQISAPFAQVYRAEATFAQCMYWLICALWSLVVWAFFGGAITRIVAVSFARQENVSWGKVAGFVRPRLPAYFAAPLFIIVATFGAALFLGLLGLLLRSEAGEIGVLVAGILWPLVLLGGFTMAFLLVGLFFGWPLMWAAISAEGTDSFGALSHALSYTYQRPLRYLLYAAAAAVIGVLGWYLVATFAFWIIELGHWGVSWGSGAGRIREVTGNTEWGRLGTAGVTLIEFWTKCVATLALAFVFSYFWTASTVIYFLLRRLVDATELDEVYLQEEHELHALPPLKTGADGVAEPADEPAA